MSSNINSLIIDDGSLEYEIKNKSGNVIGKFRINPADVSLCERAEKAAERLSGLSYPDDASVEGMMAIFKDFEQQVHALFNDLLSYDAAPELFSGCAALALLSDGDFYFEKVLANIVALVEHHSGRRIAAKLSKVRKATEKYRK